MLPVVHKKLVYRRGREADLLETWTEHPSADL